MQISFGYDFNEGKVIQYKSVNDPFQYEHNIPEENMLVDLVVKLGGKDFKICKQAEDYTTLQYKDYDLCRLKYTPKSHWIKIFIPPTIKPKYIDSTLFYSQDNKNQLYWVSHFSISLEDYIEVLKDSMDFIDKQKKS